MHMADALLAPGVAATMFAASGVAAGISIAKLKKDENTQKLPTMAVTAALVFAGQMINYTIPGTGSSGHLCGGMLLSALLGPYAGFLSMIVILTIQCLFFADGGLMALGANVWNMAFYGCFIGALLIWKPMMKGGMNKKKITLASIIGCVLTLQLGALSVTIETLISGITELPFGVFLGTMLPIHLAIGFVEGLITAVVLCFVYEARPELIFGAETVQKEDRFSMKTTLTILGVAALVIGGFVSLFASAFPDGLEWSMERIAGTTELEATGNVYDKFAAVQESTSFLPDYAFTNSDSPLGTTVSGIVGGLIVLVVCIGASYAFRFFRNKKAEA